MRLSVTKLMGVPAMSGLFDMVSTWLSAALGGNYAAVVLAFGIVWILLNLYQYLPLCAFSGQNAKQCRLSTAEWRNSTASSQQVTIEGG